jgi:hypothetical protein
LGKQGEGKKPGQGSASTEGWGNLFHEQIRLPDLPPDRPNLQRLPESLRGCSGLKRKPIGAERADKEKKRANSFGQRF